MNREEIQNGRVYRIKHSSGIITARLIDTIYPSHNGRTMTRYIMRSLKTGREIVIKSSSKFLAEEMLN